MADDDREARLDFAYPLRHDADGELDPSRPDDARQLIVAERPELAPALAPDAPRRLLQALVLQEATRRMVVDAQPPAYWSTAQRLLAAGHPRDDVLSMLFLVTVRGIAARASGKERPGLVDDELDALPGSWEEHRKQMGYVRALASRTRPKPKRHGRRRR